MINYTNDSIAPLEHVHTNILLPKALNRLFELGREVVFCAVNDERLTIKEISDSISTYGYSTGEFISGYIGWKDLLHPDDLKNFMDCISAEKKGQNSLAFECRILTKEGDPVWISCLTIPEKNKEGQITHFLCKISDISLNKQYESELAASHEELEQKVRIRTEEVEAVNVYLESINQQLQSANAELQTINEELRVTNEKLFINNEKLHNEITARLEVMKQLEDSESKTRNFIHHSFEGIVILDNEGRIIEWNKATEQIMGLSREEALGKYEWDVLKPYFPKDETFEKLRQLYMEYILGGNKQEPIVEEYIIQLPDSTIRYIHVSLFPIIQSGANYFGHIISNITDRKLAEIRLGRYRTQLETMVEIQTHELLVTQERLMSLSNNLPGGIIFQMMDDSVRSGWFSHVSTCFSDIFEIDVEEIMVDPTPFYMCIHPKDRKNLIKTFIFANEKKDIDIEFRIQTLSGKNKWIHMRSSHHITDEGAREWNGFMIDITERKIAMQELENTHRRQALLIEVQQIIQSAENLSDAIILSLAEIGRFTDVSRIYIFEKNIDGTTINNTFEWCNEGVKPVINDLQNLPVETAQPWFNIFNSGGFVYASDINTLIPAVADELSAQGVKSIILFPLISGGVICGFVGFDDCNTNREWNKGDVELLKSLSRVISNVTRRHQAETSLRLSQQVMRTVLDNIDAKIFVTDFDTSTILFANEKMKKMSGSEIEGKECWKVAQSGKTGVCDDCPRPHLRDSNNLPTVPYHWQHRNKSTGCYYDDTSIAINWVDGRLVHLEYSIDITDRKKAEEAVRQSEEMYRQLTVASPDAIIVCTPSGLIRYASPKAFDLLCLAKGSILQHIHKYIHPNERRQVYSLLDKTDNYHTIVLPELLMLRQNGSEFTGEISAAFVKGSDRKEDSVIMVIRDITRRKKEKMELILAKEKAEESDRLKSSFLGNLSHEIRTPLNGIATLLSILGQDPDLPDSIREYIDVINTNSEQLLKLINDIIDLAKIEAKQMSIHPEQLCINNLMDDMYSIVKTALSSQGKTQISLECIIDENIKNCELFADPVRLKQVLQNLLSNAVKFTEQGYIRFGCRLVNSIIEFFVEDSGIGIPEDQMNTIFQWFRQAELENNRRYGGTGLGLTIARSLVLLMGGNMRVDSTEGYGSSFYFTISYLPVTQKDKFLDKHSDKMLSPDNSYSNKTVLVFVPILLKYKYYELLLSAIGFTVKQAQNMQQCLDILRLSNRIDAMIIDMSMFDKENIEEIKQIKSIHENLPLILVGSKQNLKYKHVIRDCKCSAVFEEPVNREEIVKTMKQLIQ